VKEIVQLTPDDDKLVQASYHLKQVAFGHTEDRVARWRETVAKEPVLAVVEGGELLGVTTIHPYRQWFAGREMPSGGLGGVAVAAHARRRGVATTMLAAVIERMHADGQPVSTLYPSNPPVYRRSGWEIAGVLAFAELSTLGMPAAAPPGEVALRPVDRGRPASADAAAVEALYTAAARPAVGPLTRTGSQFEAEKLAESDAMVIASVDGVDAGYVSWSRKDRTLQVHDLIADRASVRDTLLNCVGSWQTTIATARIRFGDPVAGSLALPRGSMVTHDPWMLRIVDAPAAVAARGFGPREGSIDLVLIDPQAPWHEGHWRLSVSGGAGTLTRGGSGEVSLRAQGLAALFTGFAGAPALVAAGLADGQPAALARLAALFAGPTPWMLDDF
jgi:predicted acetyltransferase